MKDLLMKTEHAHSKIGYGGRLDRNVKVHRQYSDFKLYYG